MNTELVKYIDCRYYHLEMIDLRGPERVNPINNVFCIVSYSLPLPEASMFLAPF